MRPEDRADYIVACLRESAAMYEDGARAFLAEHDAEVRAKTLNEAATVMDAHCEQYGVFGVGDRLRRMAAGQAPAPQPETAPGTCGRALATGQPCPDHPTPGADGLRERIKQALSNAGAFCGDDCCGFQPGDRGCPDCERHWERCADALIPVLAEGGAS